MSVLTFMFININANDGKIYLNKIVKAISGLILKHHSCPVKASFQPIFCQIIFLPGTGLMCSYLERWQQHSKKYPAALRVLQPGKKQPDRLRRRACLLTKQNPGQMVKRIIGAPKMPF
jgi:hypothetical protein